MDGPSEFPCATTSNHTVYLFFTTGAHYLLSVILVAVASRTCAIPYLHALPVSVSALVSLVLLKVLGFFIGCPLYTIHCSCLRQFTSLFRTMPLFQRSFFFLLFPLDSL
ncbi:hypothetical protein GQ44DRAFT_217567 [Phaeosphaeriaceae sp. PMI808]|nr:hypothetical protein GQ44DRAFT_217567 [Phaeosphaeriaceae sp. PMI808]